MISSQTAFAVAGSFAAFGCVLVIRKTKRLRHWHRAKGRVVRLRSDNCGTAPVLKFVPLGRSEELTVESRLFVTGVRHEIGKQVEIVYDPSDPSKASIASFGELHFPAIWCFGVAAVWTFGAFLVRSVQ
jgi:hypothetical protein